MPSVMKTSDLSCRQAKVTDLNLHPIVISCKRSVGFAVASDETSVINDK